MTQNGNEYYVNSAFGRFTDSIAPFFKKVYFAAGVSKQGSQLYSNGKSIYTYQIQAPNVVLAPLAVNSINKSALSRARQLILNQKVVSKLIKESDWIHTHMPSSNGLLSCLQAVMQNKAFSLYVGSDWEETGHIRLPSKGILSKMNIARPLLEIYPMLESQLVKKSRFVLTTGKRLKERYAALNPRTSMTVPWVQFTESDDTTVKEKSNIQRILYVGAIARSKGVDQLVSALNLLETTTPRVVTLVGGAKPEFIDELHSHNQSEHTLEFAGYVSDPEKLKQLYQEADIFVLPSLGEGFPRVLYESMLSNIPIIASDLPSIRENLGADDIVALIEPGCATAIASELQALYDDEDRQAAMVSKGAKFAQERLNGSSQLQFIEQVAETLYR